MATDINLYQGEDQFRLLFEDSNEYIIREPEGWDQFLYVIGRDPKKHGFITSFTNEDIMLKFSKESGKDYIDAEYEAKGADGTIILRFGTWDGVNFEEEISMRLSLHEYEKYFLYTECGAGPLEETEKFRTRLDAKADINGDKDFDNNTIEPLVDENFILHSKVLQKETKLTRSSTETTSEGTGLGISINPNIPPEEWYPSLTLYATLGLDFIEPEEIDKSYAIMLGSIKDYNLINALILYKAKERGDHTFEINVTFLINLSIVISQIVALGYDEGSYDTDECLLKIELILKIGNEEIVLYDMFTDECGVDSLSTESEINVNETIERFIEQNETVNLYFKFTAQKKFFNIDGFQTLLINLFSTLIMNEGSYFKITGLTQTRYSNSGASLIHEAFDKALEVITGTNRPLKSNFLGRSDIGYVANGCGSKYALTGGKKIRNLPSADSHIKFSGNDFFNSINAIFCCGMGLEYDDGKYFFIGEVDIDKLYTSFLIPDFTNSELEFFDSENNSIGVINSVERNGDGSFDDPFYYSWGEGTLSSTSLQTLSVIVKSLENRQVVRFEQREYFYRDIELFYIPADRIDRNSYRESVNRELIVNEINIGYKKFPEDELLSLDEFATKQEYLLPIKNIKNKLEIYSDFIASGYAIELQRRKQFDNLENGKSSSAYDDDIFIIALTSEKYEVPVYYFNENIVYLKQKLVNPPTPPFDITVFAESGGTTVNAGTYTVEDMGTFGFLPKMSFLVITSSFINESSPVLTNIVYEGGQYTPERTQPFETVENIVGPNSSYNLRLSVKRMLHNWGKWINSGLFHKEGTEIIKNTFTKNNIVSGSLITQFKEIETCTLGDDNYAVINESTDVILNELTSNMKILKPNNIEFKARLKRSEVQYITDRLKRGYLENAYGYLRFEDLEGVEKKAFIKQIKFNPSIETVEFLLEEKA